MEQLSSKLKNSTTWETKDFSEDVDGKCNASIQGILKHSKLDSLNFYLHLKDRLREISKSFNGKIIEPLYQVSVKMAATPSTFHPESWTYATNKGVIITAVPVNSITEFWLATVSTFGALYEAEYVSVYSTLGQRQDTPDKARCWIDTVSQVVLAIVPFTELSLFEESENGSHDFCGKIRRSMKEGSSVGSWIK